MTLHWYEISMENCGFTKYKKDAGDFKYFCVKMQMNVDSLCRSHWWSIDRDAVVLSQTLRNRVSETPIWIKKQGTFASKESEFHVLALLV